MSATSAMLFTVVILMVGQLVLFGLSLLAHLKWKVSTRRIIENSIRRNIGRWLRGRNQETC